MNLLRRLLPFVGWLSGYDRAALRADALSGLTVALVLVPQSMAYAQLAGLPPYYGLYAAFLPPLVASLFGSSRQLATGPVAMVSLVTAASLSPLATAGGESYILYAILLALLVGAFQFVLGVLRLGLIVNFLSHPVVNGFTNAAALIIATSQLSKIFGVTVEKADHHYETVGRVLSAALDSTHLPTLGMATGAFVVMIALRRANRRLPNVLIAVVLTTLVAWATGFERNRVTSLKQIDSERVTDAVVRLNQVIESRERLERIRADGRRSLPSIHEASGDFCIRCHERRSLDDFEREPGGRHLAAATAHVLALHQMSGLLDAEIAALKTVAADLRPELRSFCFALQREGGDGGPRFRLLEEGDRETGATTWRLDVGSGTLPTDRLTMVGGGAVVGEIPAGLPALRAPEIELGIASKLITAAMIISLLGFMEAISIAKAMAAKTRQRLDPNQELIGQGLANIVGCLSQGYAVSGSFSRSAVNLQAGARTGLSSVFSSLVVMIVLLFLSGTLYHLPQAVLAAIIMMAVFGLLNVSGFVHAWRTNRFDGIVSIVVFASTLILAPHLEWGLLLGVSLSLGGYLFRTMRPKVAALAPHADGSMRDALRHSLPTCRYMAVIGFDGPLNFASTSYLEDEMLKRVSQLPDLRHLLISCEGMIEIDASGEEVLRHMVERMRGAGYHVSFSGLKDEVLDVLRRSHLLARIGEENVHATQAQAVAAIYTAAHRRSREEHCPFRTIMPKLTELSLHADGSLRDAARHGLPLCRHIAALRFDDPLTFANTALLEQEVVNLVSRYIALRHVIFVAHGISSIDAAGAEKLAYLVEVLQRHGYSVSFTGLKEDVWDMLERTGTLRTIRESNCYPTQLMAVAAVYADAHANSGEVDCPLRRLAPSLQELSMHADGSLRSAERHGLARCRHVAVLRFQGPLDFTTIGFLEGTIDRRTAARPELREVLIVGASLARIDAAAANGLARITRDMRRQGIDVSFSGFNDDVLDVLEQTRALEQIGEDSIYPNHVWALELIRPRAHDGSSESACPLIEYVPAE